jgi:hypothetical protein
MVQLERKSGGPKDSATVLWIRSFKARLVVQHLLSVRSHLAVVNLQAKAPPFVPRHRRR